MNSGTAESDFQRDKLPLDALRELLPAFRILKEKPLTHPGNYIIVWGGQ